MSARRAGRGAGPRRGRPLLGLLTAFAIARTGTGISAIALPWFVLVTSDSAVRTGLVAFCELTPYVLAKALAGPVVDRTGPRVVSWTTDLVSASCAAVIPLLHTAGALPFPLLLALVAVIGAARGPGDLAKEVMVPEAADRSGVPMERATGLSGVVERLAGTVAPAAGGALVALAGAMTGLLVNAVCFALGSLVIAAVLPRGMGGPAARPAAPAADPGAPPGGEREPGYWRSLREGAAFVRSDRMLGSLLVLVAVTNFLDAAFSAVLLPVWVRESGYGPSTLGLLASVFGASAVAGSVCAAAIAHRLPRRPVFFAGFLVSGAPRFVVLALAAEGAVPLGAVVAVFALGGCGAGFLNPIIGAMVFERVPRHLLGRAQAIGDSLAFAPIPFGGLAAGAAVVVVGLSPVLFVLGAVYLVATTGPPFLASWRDMDRRPGRQSGSTPAAAGAGAEVEVGAAAVTSAEERGPLAT
ncbi:MFS transporter [Streptomyces avicenniae]|uniref:MFS transporter n=1 Tax=Streptomyces avicenniae TaxID=500153 RepID=UPI000AE9A713|nr:MFS transporter [Streptomyces avicenniae]